MAINLCAAMFVFGGRVADRAGTLMRAMPHAPRKMNCYYIVVYTVKVHLRSLEIAKARGIAVAEHTKRIFYICILNWCYEYDWLTG